MEFTKRKRAVEEDEAFSSIGLPLRNTMTDGLWEEHDENGAEESNKASANQQDTRPPWMRTAMTPVITRKPVPRDISELEQRHRALIMSYVDMDQYGAGARGTNRALADAAEVASLQQRAAEYCRSFTFIYKQFNQQQSIQSWSTQVSLFPETNRSDIAFFYDRKRIDARREGWNQFLKGAGWKADTISQKLAEFHRILAKMQWPHEHYSEHDLPCNVEDFKTGPIHGDYGALGFTLTLQECTMFEAFVQLEAGGYVYLAQQFRMYMFVYAACYVYGEFARVAIRWNATMWARSTTWPAARFEQEQVRDSTGALSLSPRESGLRQNVSVLMSQLLDVVSIHSLSQPRELVFHSVKAYVYFNDFFHNIADKIRAAAAPGQPRMRPSTATLESTDAPSFKGTVSVLTPESQQLLDSMVAASTAADPAATAASARNDNAWYDSDALMAD